MAKRLSKQAFKRISKGSKFRKVMREYGNRTLRSSDGTLVTDVKKATAIAISEQQRANKGKK